MSTNNIDLMKKGQKLSFSYHQIHTLSEPRCEKTGLRGFRPGPTQSGLYDHRRWLEA